MTEHWWHKDRTGDKQQVAAKGTPPKPEPRLPSAADLDAIAAEQKAADETASAS